MKSPAADTIPAALATAAAEFAEADAIVEGDEHVSFLDLYEAATGVAKALVASGEAGDRVALWAPNSLRWVIASFGIYREGAVLVPLNTRFQRGRELLGPAT